MDTFELEWSVQKLTYSKAYAEAGQAGKNKLWCNEHVKFRLIKKKAPDQTLECFISEVKYLKKNVVEDIRLRVRFVINGRYLDKMICFQDKQEQYYLFLEGHVSVPEFVAHNQAYDWANFFIKKFLGKPFSVNDMYWFDNCDEAWAKNQYQEELARGVQLYCCPICGDRDCGNFEVKIHHQGNKIVWDWSAYQSWWKLPLNFYFDKNSYIKVFAEYKAYIEQQIKIQKASR
ncbi:hypothetical protein [Microscilla marina]|uniref:Uncharacterized protein n=1 Tax=Microscilla marina ATCC 23134 TaxID=313606 RepID=A1ZRS6_MICM2|nr:hypothetical protein [Microscilla marina]EAY26981.1 conserved hypothetical protein [Microscilla marina ATCC 23134]